LNTPAHLLLGTAAFGNPARRYTTAAALIGSLAPDISLYLLVGIALFIQQISPQVVFGELYFSDEWQQIFAVDNSFLIWGAVLALGLWWRRHWLIAFCAAGLLHLATDFALHNEDARMQFWPLTDWMFRSPFSYWDRRFGAAWIGPLEVVVSGLMLVILWRRYPGWWLRILFLGLMALELGGSVPVEMALH